MGNASAADAASRACERRWRRWMSVGLESDEAARRRPSVGARSRRAGRSRGSRRLGELRLLERERAVEPVRSAPRRRRSRPSRRTRCAGPAARRDRRRCRRRPSPFRAGPRAPWRTPPAPRPAARRPAGSTTFRQTLVLERVAGTRGEEIDPRRARDPIGDRLGVGVGARDQRLAGRRGSSPSCSASI